MRKQEAWVLGFVIEKMIYLIFGDGLSVWEDRFIFNHQITHVRETQPGWGWWHIFHMEQSYWF